MTFLQASTLGEGVCLGDSLERWAVTALYTHPECSWLLHTRSEAPNDTARQKGAPDLTWALGER